MNGWCVFVHEDAQVLAINYSLEENMTCDGRLSFDKKTQAITVLELSHSATKTQTEQFICSVRGRIRRGFEFNKRYYLPVG